MKRPALNLRRRTVLIKASQGALALALPTLATKLAYAQSDYPNRSIRVIVPFAPGSATDILTRHLEQSMSATLGQKIIVENRAGANGVLGAQVVKSASPDGYTFCMGSTSSHSIVAAMRPNSMPYDIVKDFSPIGLAAMSANIIAIHPAVPVKNIQELIAYSNTLPSGLSYASSPAGSSNSLAGDMLRTKGAKLVNIPYNNISQGITDVLAGHVPVKGQADRRAYDPFVGYANDAFAGDVALQPMPYPGTNLAGAFATGRMKIEATAFSFREAGDRLPQLADRATLVVTPMHLGKTRRHYRVGQAK